MTEQHELVRGLRYRRWLGRHHLIRGQTPGRPKIAYKLNAGCLGVFVVIVGIIAAAYVLTLVVVAVGIAIYVLAALAALLIVPPYYRWVMPVLRGSEF